MTEARKRTDAVEEQGEGKRPKTDVFDFLNTMHTGGGSKREEDIFGLTGTSSLQSPVMGRHDSAYKVRIK